MEDVEQSLRRADQIEMVDRIIEAGLAGSDEVVWIQVGLQKSDVGDTSDPEEMLAKGYSQGYKYMDRQILAVLTGYLHENYDSLPQRPDMRRMEEFLRRDLRFSGYDPEVVCIIGPEGTIEYSDNLWHIEYSVDGRKICDAYISPLTSAILREMSGVLITSALIALTLIFGFIYLLHVIKRQRTIEEMKDDFTDNMTHELKTPIAVAYAAADSLLQFPEPGDDNRTNRYLTAILEQLTKLSGLVESILSMSMERRKNLIMTKENILLRPFLTDLIDRQKLKACKPCRINLRCPEGAAVEADPIHFSNILTNLIDNSLKYSGDQVIIDISATSHGVSVADNGIGIPARYLPDIFKKFYRVPQGRIREVGGYGIGLFYVNTIVEKHGWHISVESIEEHGTKFTIEFN